MPPAQLLHVTPAGCAPETGRPDASKVLAGDPVHTTWNLEERDGLCCGLWQSTPGKWRVSYAEWEYVHIRSGHSILADAAIQQVLDDRSQELLRLVVRQREVDHIGGV